MKIDKIGWTLCGRAGIRVVMTYGDRRMKPVQEKKTIKKKCLTVFTRINSNTQTFQNLFYQKISLPKTNFQYVIIGDRVGPLCKAVLSIHVSTVFCETISLTTKEDN